VSKLEQKRRKTNSSSRSSTEQKSASNGSTNQRGALESKTQIKQVKTAWTCAECKRTALAHSRKCPSCNQEWTLVQQVDEIANSNEGLELLGARPYDDKRIALGVPWIDQLTEGGIPRSYVLLLGGEPGSGKSTVTTAASCRADVDTSLYFGSEEPAAQAHNRAHLLGLADLNHTFQRAHFKYSANIDDLPRICAKLHPDLIIVDSLHSMKSEKPGLKGRAGHHTQAKYAAQLLVDLCKEFHCAGLAISHVSNGYFKGGSQIEHWVDAAILMRMQMMKSANGDEEIRRVAKVTKGRFCSLTGWRDVTVREWSQNAMRSNLSPLPVVDPSLQQLLDASQEAGKQANDQLVDEDGDIEDGEQFDLPV
jgi:predicted ATP-dependent serine protease